MKGKNKNYKTKKKDKIKTISNFKGQEYTLV